MAELSQASADGAGETSGTSGASGTGNVSGTGVTSGTAGVNGSNGSSRIDGTGGASGPDGAGQRRAGAGPGRAGAGPGARAGPPRGPGRGRASSPEVLVIVCAGVVLASLDLFIVNVALPAIARDLGSRSLSDLSWVLNGYAIVYAALLVPAGGSRTGTGARTGSCSVSPSLLRRPRRAARRPASAC